MFPYVPRPWHILLPVVIILLTAIIAGFFATWQMVVAFVAITAICLGAGIWISVAGIIQKDVNRWEHVGEDIRLLKNTPPELWGALGFVTPPQTVHISSNVTGEPGESTYLAIKNFTLKLSPEKMQIIADALLTGAKSLAESEWQNTEIGQTKIREVKHEMFRADLIQLRNPKNSLSGFILTEKGVTYLWQYASDFVKEANELPVLLSRTLPRPSG